ncbi:MAG: hypothetical protein ACI81I_000099 [Arcobacteraceae bacterium]|jgi:hypothetical protein
MKKIFFIIVIIFAILQLIPAKIENPKTDKNLEIKVSPELMTIFRRSCYDCHSNQVTVPWYQSVSPASFFIKRHIDLGRKWLNFSTWENYTEEEKDKKLKGIFRTVYAAMPLASYVSIHKDAALSKEEIKLIRDWTGKAPF